MNNCPTCGHEIVNIIYGNPSKMAVEIAKIDGIALAGKKWESGSPEYYCYGCHETIKKSNN